MLLIAEAIADVPEAAPPVSPLEACPTSYGRTQLPHWMDKNRQEDIKNQFTAGQQRLIEIQMGCRNNNLG